MTRRIVYISAFYPGYGGGNGRAAHEMAETFASQYDVLLLCPGDRTELTPANKTNLRIFTVKSTGTGSLRIPLFTQRNIQQIFSLLDQFQPDIVHAHDPTLLGLIGQVWAKMSHIPFVYTAHVIPQKSLEFGTKDVIKLPLDFIAEPVTMRFLEDFYRNCDAVIALNPIVGKSIRDFGYTGRIFTIPNGRFLRKYDLCRSADVTQSTKILSFIGFITRRKNQAYLIEMLSHLPANYRLRIIGTAIDPQYLQEIETYTQQQGLLDRVEFTGEIQHGEIPRRYEQSHVVVSASKMEVQSLVVIEALASGTPVIGLSNETVDELVDDTNGARLPKETSPAEFARRVERICNLSQVEYDRLCQNARQRVQHLDWGNVMAMASEAYEDLANDQDATIPIDGIHLARMIALLPPGQVRRVLAERTVSMVSRVKKVRRVSQRTWLYAALTAAGSMFVYLFLRRRVGKIHT